MARSLNGNGGNEGLVRSSRLPLSDYNSVTIMTSYILTVMIILLLPVSTVVAVARWYRLREGTAIALLTDEIELTAVAADSHRRGGDLRSLTVLTANGKQVTGDLFDPEPVAAVTAGISDSDGDGPPGVRGADGHADSSCSQSCSATTWTARPASCPRTPTRSPA